jgi:hypothetical protein
LTQRRKESKEAKSKASLFFFASLLPLFLCVNSFSYGHTITMYHLRSLKRQPSAADHYPFNIPAVQPLHQLDFTAPVTFFVGANGSGKSTLLEAIAVAAGSITVGSDDIQRDPTLNPVRELAQTLRLTWTVKTRQGLFAVTGPPAYLPVPAQADGGPELSVHHRHPLTHYHGLCRCGYLEF